MHVVGISVYAWLNFETVGLHHKCTGIWYTQSLKVFIFKCNMHAINMKMPCPCICT